MKYLKATHQHACLNKGRDRERGREGEREGERKKEREEREGESTLKKVVVRQKQH